VPLGSIKQPQGQGGHQRYGNEGQGQSECIGGKVQRGFGWTSRRTGKHQHRTQHRAHARTPAERGSCTKQKWPEGAATAAERVQPGACLAIEPRHAYKWSMSSPNYTGPFAVGNCLKRRPARSIPTLRNEQRNTTRHAHARVLSDLRRRSLRAHCYRHADFLCHTGYG
jgi:hypothetical protein